MQTIESNFNNTLREIENKKLFRYSKNEIEKNKQINKSIQKFS